MPGPEHVAVPLTTTIDGERRRTARDLPDVVRCGVIDAVYVHVPFCFHKCHYCDFYSFVDRQDRQGVFVDRLIEEMTAAAHGWSAPLDSIFVGGGTPTLLAPPHWKRLLASMRSVLPLSTSLEFTVEANPETVTPELAEVLAAGGVNRASIGAQSFEPRHLQTLERWHDPASVVRAAGILREAGIDNINLDLIFGIPGQRLEEWYDDLDAALALGPSHLSCYGLTYEANTAMTRRLEAGAFERIDDALEAEMYGAARTRLAAAGFEQYEISNWARRAGNGIRACRHNLAYWRSRNWWPLGPSASGHVEGWRWKNVPRLGDYLDASPWPPIGDVEHLDDDGQVGERLMLGLRLNEGIAAAELKMLLARGARGGQRRAAFERHTTSGLLEWNGDRLRLTPRGQLLADTVLAEVV
ncbi:MAG: radical SAM family heme chaperone HemW [Phycisphaerales bacterium]|nr:radical SAM family heme chaperone HemW [Phycisphaerales bacterium]